MNNILAATHPTRPFLIRVQCQTIVPDAELAFDLILSLKEMYLKEFTVKMQTLFSVASSAIFQILRFVYFFFNGGLNKAFLKIKFI